MFVSVYGVYVFVCLFVCMVCVGVSMLIIYGACVCLFLCMVYICVIICMFCIYICVCV